MVGTLNLYLDPELQYTWWEASLVAAKSMGTGIKNGSKQARNIHTWIHNYLAQDRLPTHHHGQHSKSILDHEDFAQDIQLHLMVIAKNSYIHAQDVVDYVTTLKIQEKLGSKSHTILVQTAQRWLKQLNWQYGKKPNGMYVDGHEREDVVQYQKEFIAIWKDYEKQMVTYDKDGNIDFTPTGFPIAQGHCFQLILVTHDESTFYTNDWWYA